MKFHTEDPSLLTQRDCCEPRDDTHTRATDGDLLGHSARMKKASATGRKRKAPPESEAALPALHEQLASLYAATLTAASFLAPKGVACTLERLLPVVQSLSRMELTADALRTMAAIDAQLALKYAVSPSGGVVLELVLRESLRMVSTPGAVRSRCKRFRQLLRAHGDAESLPLAPLPPQPDGLPPAPPPSMSPSRPAAAAAACGDVRGSDGSSSSTTVAAGASAEGASETSGLPSPPPRQLRRADFAPVVSPNTEAPTAAAAPGAATSDASVEGAHEEAATAPPLPPKDILWDAIGGELAEGHGCDETHAARSSSSRTIAFLRVLRKSAFYKDQVVHYHEQSARPPAYAPLRSPLAPAVTTLLEAAGRSRLYSHQAEAIDELLDGGHVMLCTPTASGKSLGYTVPTLHLMATCAEARAIYIFPTKALAQDQMRALRSLSCMGSTPLFGLPIHTYDGDTPQSERAGLRASTRIFLTNPDMLHMAMLPAHAEWAAVLANLKLVVVDEAHMYKGVFGAHVALILRRLRRLAALYGAKPSFACCSATVGNPSDVFEQLTGVRGAKVITADGSPHGRRRLLLWNPPLQNQSTLQIPAGKGVPLTRPPERPASEQPAEGAGGAHEPPDPADMGSSVSFRNLDHLNQPRESDYGRRQSSNIEAAVLFGEMVRARLKTICFCSVRKICELVLDYARQHLSAADGREAAKLLGAYRGGLTPADRRRVERNLYDGTLRGVTATSSLELGVDIAALDGVVMVGFPGSLASLWQRAGRCGRSADSDALCILIAYPSAIDQWAMRNPRKLLSMGVEASIIDTANPIVLQQHILCAAKEQPLTPADEAIFDAQGGRLYREAIASLHAAEKLVPLPPSSWRCDVLVERPCELVNIRSIDQSRVQVIMHSCRRRTQPTVREGFEAAHEATAAETELHEEVVDEVERWRCWYELYEGAIYLNQGRKLEVTSWEVPNGVVRVRPVNVRYYTGSLDKTVVRILQRYHTCPLHLEAGEGGSTDTTAGPADAQALDADGGALDAARQAAIAVLGQLCLGRVQVTLSVSGFVKRWQKTGEIFEEVPLRMPHHTYCTRACWLDLPESSSAEIARAGLEIDSGLHAVAHAVLAVLPLRLACEAGDLGCECDELRKRTLWPKRLLLFDRQEGGLGISDRAHPVLLTLVADALKLMKECPCVEGCYCCCHSSKCLEYNACNDKRAGIAVAQLLIDAATRPPSVAAKAAAASAAAAAASVAAAQRRREEDGSLASELRREQADGEHLQPSMLGASIRRLWNFAPAGAASKVVRTRMPDAPPADDSASDDMQCSDCERQSEDPS